MEQKHNIIILERNSVGIDVDTDCFKDFGTVTAYSNTVTPEDAGMRITDAKADIVISNKVPLGETALDNSNVKLIAQFATGFDNIDLDYCSENGITVVNLGNYATDSVAQHTFALHSVFSSIFIITTTTSNQVIIRSRIASQILTLRSLSLPVRHGASQEWAISDTALQRSLLRLAVMSYSMRLPDIAPAYSMNR